MRKSIKMFVDSLHVSFIRYYTNEKDRKRVKATAALSSHVDDLERNQPPKNSKRKDSWNIEYYPTTWREGWLRQRVRKSQLVETFNLKQKYLYLVLSKTFTNLVYCLVIFKLVNWLTECFRLKIRAYLGDRDTKTEIVNWAKTPSNNAWPLLT